MLGDVGDGWDKPEGDKFAEGFIVDVCGLMLAAAAVMDGDNSPIIIAAGGSGGNPGMVPGTIVGGLDRKGAAGDGSNLADVEVAIDDAGGVMIFDDIEDNPVIKNICLRVIKL